MLSKKISRMHQIARLEAEQPTITLKEIAETLNISIDYVKKLHSDDDYILIYTKHLDKYTDKYAKQCIEAAYKCILRRIEEKDDHKAALQFLELYAKNNELNINIGDNRSQSANQFFIPVYSASDTILNSTGLTDDVKKEENDDNG